MRLCMCMRICLCTCMFMCSRDIRAYACGCLYVVDVYVHVLCACAHLYGRGIKPCQQFHQKRDSTSLHHLADGWGAVCVCVCVWGRTHHRLHHTHPTTTHTHTTTTPHHPQTHPTVAGGSHNWRGTRTARCLLWRSSGRAVYVWWWWWEGRGVG